LHINENSWLVEKSRAMNAVTPSQKFCACRNRFLDLVVYTVQDLLRREWAKFGRRIHWVADLQSAHACDELIEKLVVNLVRDHKTFRCDTRLPSVDGARFNRGA